jgi:hypothetical protein
LKERVRKTQEGTMYRATTKRNPRAQPGMAVPQNQAKPKSAAEACATDWAYGSKERRYISFATLEAEEAAGGHYQDQGEEGYGDFADEAYGEGAEALFAHFAEVGAEAYASEG